MRICIQTVDTDIIVIAVSVFNQLAIEQLCIEFGTGKNKWWLPVHEYAASLGSGRRSVEGFDSRMLLQAVIPHRHLLVVERRWHGLPGVPTQK